MPTPLIFDVTAATFTEQVVERSQSTPILLDFWAEWCGPCKTLTPVLEALATEYGGTFLLGKVNSEAEPELASAFQIRGIPRVVLMVGGRPADAFTGALPDREVRDFLKRQGIEPAEALEEAEQEAEGEAARLAQAKRLLLTGDLAAVRAELDQVSEESDLAAERDRLGEGLAFLEADLAAAETPAAEGLARGREALRSGQVHAAMDLILGSIEVDRGALEGLGRKGMLLCFALLGEASEDVATYRRRLATLLY
ncbi:MAG: tetratricopeptide repeat protein [Planctomycetota bacterium]